MRLRGNRRCPTRVHLWIRATTNACPDAKVEVTDKNCHGTIIESRYTDNAAYAYFEIVHSAAGKPVIQEIERGMGQGPFDPEKQIVHDNRRFLYGAGI